MQIVLENYGSVNMIMQACIVYTETAQAEQKERLQQNFIKYFDKVADKRHSN